MNAERTVGRRLPRPEGVLRSPTAEEEVWVERMHAGRPTGVPRGVFRYRSHEEANADWERWHAGVLTADVQVP
jgi:hypothetical protein